MEAVIIDCLRTAVGKAPRGTLRNTRPLIRRVAGLEGSVAVLISRADEAEVRIRDLTKRVQDLEAGAGAPILPVI